jgi:Na+/H+ antiporter NhaD/arsenite permease-like protein
MIILLIGFSFVENKPDITNGLICVLLLVVGLIQHFLVNNDYEELKRIVKSIDYQTLILLMGLFVVIASLVHVGIIEDIAKILADIGGGSIFFLFTIIVIFSVILSGFIDNIPYVATMLPIVESLAAILSTSPYLLYFGLITGATLGGNLTPIGASANIAALSILKKEGIEVKTTSFMKISVPFTLIAVTSGYLLVWVIYH